MNYELALKLSNARFPFNSYRDWDKSDYFWYPCLDFTKQERRKLYIPTLEELIEECGDNLIDLTRTDDGWTTNSENSLTQIEGKTPTEAVANLWLALNKKS